MKIFKLEIYFQVLVLVEIMEVRKFQSGMKIHGCSCSFVFAVFNNFNKARVRVRSCSIFSKTNVFVFVRVRHFSKKVCSCSFVFSIFTKSTRSCSVRVHVRVRYRLYRKVL